MSSVACQTLTYTHDVSLISFHSSSFSHPPCYLTALFSFSLLFIYLLFFVEEREKKSFLCCLLFSHVALVDKITTWLSLDWLVFIGDPWIYSFKNESFLTRISIPFQSYIIMFQLASIRPSVFNLRKSVGSAKIQTFNCSR